MAVRHKHIRTDLTQIRQPVGHQMQPLMSISKKKEQFLTFNAFCR